MQVSRVQLPHPARQPRKRIERHRSGIGLTPPRCRTPRRRKGLQVPIQFRRPFRRIFLERRSMIPPSVVQRIIQLLHLPRHPAPQLIRRSRCLRLDARNQLLQKFSLHIQIPHRSRRPPYRLQQPLPRANRLPQCIPSIPCLRTSVPQRRFERRLNAARSRPRIVHRIHVRISCALFQALSQCGRQILQTRKSQTPMSQLCKSLRRHPRCPRTRPPFFRRFCAISLNSPAAILVLIATTPDDDSRFAPPARNFLERPDSLRFAHPRLDASPAHFLAVHFVALFTPSLLDDADATHANAAQHMAVSGNWVTLYVNGIRYLEKPPLPYWLAAIDYHIFGYNVFATHLPMSLAVLACAILAWVWSRRAYGDRAAFYAALAILTSIGVFLWTRFFIPESLLTFFLALALYAFLTGLEDRKLARFYLAYAALAIAVLAKGLIAPVFFVAAIVPYLVITGEWRRWRQMHLFTGFMLFLAIAAPWHILAALRNPDHGNPIGNVPTPGHVHGFFYFYFINEHFLRFLGKRYPHDYNKQPWFAYWFGQLIWLFPWSIFLPAALVRAWRNRRIFASDLRYDATNTIEFLDPRLTAHAASTLAARLRFRARTSLLLALLAAFILVFFAISTNQEYYTWPSWFAILMLITGSLASIERGSRRRIRAGSTPPANGSPECTPPSPSSASSLPSRSPTVSGPRDICPSCPTSERCSHIAE